MALARAVHVTGLLHDIRLKPGLPPAVIDRGIELTLPISEIRPNWQPQKNEEPPAVLARTATAGDRRPAQQPKTAVWRVAPPPSELADEDHAV
jgi:hypothetical protein